MEREREVGGGDSVCVYELSSSEYVPGAFHGAEAMRGMWVGMVSRGCGGGVCEGSMRREHVDDGGSRMEDVRMRRKNGNLFKVDLQLNKLCRRNDKGTVSHMVYCQCTLFIYLLGFTF